MYMTSGVVWSITSLGCPPPFDEAGTRMVVYSSIWLVERLCIGIDWIKGKRGGPGQRGRLDVREVRIPMLAEAHKIGILRQLTPNGITGTEDGDEEEEILGFWLTNIERPSAAKARRAVVHAKRHSNYERRRHHRSLSSEEEAESSTFATAPIASPPRVPAADVPVLADGAAGPDVTAYTSPRNKNRSRSYRSKLATSHPSAPTSSARSGDRKVYLFFAGGGYVTGWPLAHPVIYSLARTFEPEPAHSDPLIDLPHRAVFAPNIRKSLSMQHAFPTPLIDAVAAYAYLLNVGYEPAEIVLLGDSAGGGMVWTVLAYLCCLAQFARSTSPRTATSSKSVQKLGLPGGVIMISPWLSLPPTPSTPYPDFLDTPQLLNAARSYMARFPIVAHRPDPFSSELSLWRKAYMQRARALVSKLDPFGVMAISANHRKGLEANTMRGSQAGSGKVLDMVADWEMYSREDPDLFSPVDTTPSALKEPHTHTDLSTWLDASVFAQMISHHPLVSPSSPAPEGQFSPFVNQVLAIARTHNVRMLMVSGTAEWFHEPARALARYAGKLGSEVGSLEEVGGFHCENCQFPAELPGPGARLVQAIRRWGGEEQAPVI